MRLAAIACRVFTRELSAAVAKCAHPVEVSWLPQGLHDTPDLLRARINGTIDAIERADAEAPARRRLDAIVLCYGLCGGGLDGVRAGRLPLVVPRADDCIGILLGSQKRYLDYLAARAGIYWYTPGWIEYADTPSRVYYDAKLRDYTARFGAENAQWLLEQENTWIGAYESGIYIAPPACPSGAFEAFAQDAARTYGWRFETVLGSAGWLEALLSGGWDARRFAVCPPGETLSRTYGPQIFPLF